MRNIQVLLGMEPLEVLEIRQHQEFLLGLQEKFEDTLAQWEEMMPLKPKETPLLVDGYYAQLVGGYYRESFYNIQYQQALQCFAKGFTLKEVAILTDRIRQFVIAESLAVSELLSKALEHVVDLVYAIFSHIFGLFASIERMKQRSTSVIKRIETSYETLSLKAPQALLDAYRNHQRWKVEVFNLSLGRKLNWEGFEINPGLCALANWLESGGLALIPLEQQESFLDAHDSVHYYGRSAIKYSELQQSEQILNFLEEMEASSDHVNHVLLELIDKELLKLVAAEKT